MANVKRPVYTKLKCFNGSISWTFSISNVKTGETPVNHFQADDT